MDNLKSRISLVKKSSNSSVENVENVENVQHVEHSQIMEKKIDLLADALCFLLHQKSPLWHSFLEEDPEFNELKIYEYATESGVKDLTNEGI